MAVKVVVTGEGDLGIILTRYEAIVAMHELEERLAFNKRELMRTKAQAPIAVGLHERHIEQLESVIAKLKEKVG